MIETHPSGAARRGVARRPRLLVTHDGHTLPRRPGRGHGPVATPARAPRGRPGAPAQVRRLVLGQGQARPRRGVAGRRRARDRRGDRRSTSTSGCRCPAAEYTVLDRHRRARDQAGPLLGRRGRRRRGPAGQRDRRGAPGSTSLAAHDRLDYARDRDQLRARRPGRRRRAAHDLAAGPRPPRQGRAPAARGRGTTPNAPSTQRGQERPRRSSPLLAAYGVTRLVSAPARCAAPTPCARMRRRPGCRCGTGTACPRRGMPRTRTAAPTTFGGWSSAAPRRRCAATVRCCRACSSALLAPGRPRRRRRRRRGRPGRGRGADGMAKGEVLVCHVVDTGDAARVTAVERYPT